MKIIVLQVGKPRERSLAAAADLYRAKLRPYAQVGSVLIPDQPVPDPLYPGAVQAVKEREGMAIVKRWPERTVMTALDAGGRSLSSLQFAAWLEEQLLSGDSQLGFVIGGVLGLSDQVLAKSEWTLSLSAFTFPHQLVPVVLLEQVYRAFRIIRGEPYHY